MKSSMELGDRECMELALMGWCNKRNEYWRHVYDCGELGILDLYIGHHGLWQSSWLDIENVPPGAMLDFGEVKKVEAAHRAAIEGIREQLTRRNV